MNNNTVEGLGAGTSHIWKTFFYRKEENRINIHV
jgi:hypothetical protein